MDYNEMTTSVRSGLQKASSVAQEFSHQAIDVEHLLSNIHKLIDNL